MTTGHGPPSATPPRHSARSKRKKPATLAPLSPHRPHNQSEDASVSALPLEVVFLNRYRRILRKHVNLAGWDPTDADLRLLASGRDGATASVLALTLDECTHVTNVGLRHASPVLKHMSLLSIRGCSSLSSDLIATLPASLVEIDLSHCEWLDDSAVRVLARRCPALRKVSLQRCRKLTDYGVSAFADVPGLPLAELNVSVLPRVTDTCLLALLMRCTKLKQLRASSLSSVEGLNLQGLPRNCAPSLETLDLSRNARMHLLTVAHLVRVLHVGKLLELDVSHCAQITDDTLIALGRHTPSFHVLRAAFCTQVTDGGVVRLVQLVPLESDQLADFVEDDASRPRCTHLRLLDLTGCYLVTDDGIRVVAAHCVKLETLLVDGVRRLHGTALSALASNCTALHTLHWGGILIQSGPGGGGSQTGFFSVPAIDAAAARAISEMRTLHTLRVGASKCDTDALARSLGRIGPHLRELDLSGIATDALCASVASHCSQLRCLRLSRSRYFSEAAFLAIATACTQLRVLDLESCEQVHDLTLTTLARHCHSLERLILSNDWQVTDVGISFLAQRCPALRRLQLRHCPEVSPQCVRAIAARNVFVVAAQDGLEPKPAAVLAFLKLDSEMDAAARRLTRWLRDTLADRTHSKSAIERALRHVRRRRRSATRIQRAVRRWLAHLRQMELVAAAQRARQLQVATNWCWVAAYCRLSRLLRRHLRRWLVLRHEAAFRRAEAERERRTKAAMDIQRVYWGWQGRQQAKRRREQLAALGRLRQASAVCLQRVWRGAKSRRRAKELAAVCWKRVVERIRLADAELLAALTLTHLARGFLGRQRARHRVLYLEELRLLRERSAATIQRSVRAHFARVLFKRRRARGATALQRVYRGFRGRRLARSVVLERAYAHAPILLLLSPRSVFSRDLAVAWKAKRDAGERIATTLQCFHRGYFRGRLPRRRLLAAKRQREFERDAAARCLQHFFRSLVIVKRLAQLRVLLRRRKRGATKIQSVWRMWRGKVLATAATLRRDRRRRHVATLAALATDGPQLRLLQLGSVHVLATAYRQSLAARGWQVPSLARFLYRCATRIQSLVRGYLTRLFVAWFRERLTSASRLVQREWRAKLGRRRWRAIVAERKRLQRLQEEEDRATRIAHKLTGQFVLDANAKFDAHARLLQQWVRTLQRLQVFRQAREVRGAALRARAADRLGSVLRLSTESVVFQARVWRECLDRKQQLNEMEESDVRAAESEVAALKRACLEEYVAHATAAAEYHELARRKRDAASLKKRLRESAAGMKETIQPFAEQAKTLTMESARVHVANRQLQDELRRLQQSVATFHSQLQVALPLDPLLYEKDVERLVALLGLPAGKLSLLSEQLHGPFER